MTRTSLVLYDNVYSDGDVLSKRSRVYIHTRYNIIYWIRGTWLEYIFRTVYTANIIMSTITPTRKKNWGHLILRGKPSCTVFSAKILGGASWQCFFLLAYKKNHGWRRGFSTWESGKKIKIIREQNSRARYIKIN